MILCQRLRIDSQGRVQIPRELMEDALLCNGDYVYISVDEVSREFVIAKQNSIAHSFVDENCQIKARIE